MTDSTKKTAVAYMRVSGRGQIDGDGHARQEHAIKLWAELHGWTIEDWYWDAGQTGTVANRQILVNLVERWREQGVALVVERPDRLARDLIVSELLIADLAGAGFQVWSAEGNERLDESDDPTRVLVRQIMGAISQYEKSSIVQKLRRARDRKKRKQGWCEGAKPFGILEGEQTTLVAIKALATYGFGPYQIAAQLNAHNRGEFHRLLHPDQKYWPRSGRKWWGSTVRQILVREQRRQLKAAIPPEA